jgi:putative transposase
MTNNNANPTLLPCDAKTAVPLLDDWFNPIAAAFRDRVRELVQTIIQSELDVLLAPPRRRRKADHPEERWRRTLSLATGTATSSRSLVGTFGSMEIMLPRASLHTAQGKTANWKSKALLAYQQRTKQADSLIVAAYLSHTSIRQLCRPLTAVFAGAVDRHTMSQVLRKVKSDWDAWNCRSLAAEPIDRLLLGSTVVRVWLNRKATPILLLVALGAREDGQKVLLALKNMLGETREDWRFVLDDLVKRGLRKPNFLMVDGRPGLEQALAALWGDVPTQPCTFQPLHNEVSPDDNDMTDATSPADIEECRPHLPSQMTPQMQGGSRQPPEGR